MATTRKTKHAIRIEQAWLTILLLWLFVPQLYSQTNQVAEAVDGWRSAKWGMNVDAVISAFPNEAEKIEKEEKWRDGVGLVEIPKLEIERTQFEAKFIFNKETRTLKQVVLRPIQGVQFPDLLFVPLEQKLTEKYGNPDFSNDEDPRGSAAGSTTKNRSWKKGQTRIELKYFELSTIGRKFLTVTYEKIAEKGDSNL